jgi:hypothetical protein
MPAVLVFDAPSVATDFEAKDAQAFVTKQHGFRKNVAFQQRLYEDHADRRRRL